MRKVTKKEWIITIIILIAIEIVVSLYKSYRANEVIVEMNKKSEERITEFYDQFKPNLKDKNLVFSYSTESEPAIAGNYIPHVWIDNNTNYIYISTSKGGLSVIDTKGTKDTNDDELVITYSKDSKPAIPSNGVHSSWMDDKTSYLYIGSSGGLSVIDTKGTKDTNDDELVITYSKDSKPAIKHNNISHFNLNFLNNYIYISTSGGGLSVIDTKGTKDINDDELVNTYSKDFDSIFRLNELSYSWFDNDNNHLYASAKGGGLAVIDTKGTKDANDDELVAKYFKNSIPSIQSYNPYHSWLDKKTNYLYIGTVDKGLAVIDTKGTKDANDDELVHTYLEKYNVSSKFWLDKENGYLYIASSGSVNRGLFVFDTKKTKDTGDDELVHTYLTNYEVYSFWFDYNSNYIYVGTNQGLAIIDIGLSQN